jgi:TolB-like protein/Tfp pilus assembly protein PilF
MQVTDVLSGLIDIPDWVGPTVLAILVIGMPITVVLSWFFQFTGTGLTRDEVAGTAPATHDGAGRQLDFIIIAVLVAALVVFAWAAWWPDTPADKSIAVMAFDNISDDPMQEYFSDGISEELLGTLARSPELKVISRSSSFSYKNRSLDIPTIARQLNVAHIVEGSVRRAGDRVRISAQLIEAKSDSPLWSATYERKLTATNVFEIQSQIATAIADALNAVLGSGRGDIAVPTRNLQALEAYLLGRQRMALRSRSGLTEAVQSFSTALELDPDYAPAYLGLADATLLLRNYGHISLDEALEVAGPALEKALALDAGLGGAYASLGLMRSLQGDPLGAAAAYEQAIAIDPNEAKAYHWYGDLLIFGIGNPDAAIPKLDAARLLDPLSPVIVVTLGQAHAETGNLVEAIHLYRRAIEIDPDFLSAYSLLGMAYLALGDSETAALWFDRAETKWPGEFGAAFGKAFLRRALGDEDKAVAAARHLQALQPGNNVTLVTLVSFGRDTEAIALGDVDWPALSCRDEPSVLRSNVFQAMNLSLARERGGQAECAAALLEGILSLLEQPGLHPRTFGFLDVEVYSRLGRIPEALAALRERVDAGVRQQWLFQIELSPHSVRLREHPDFAAIRDEVRADLARQLAVVSERQEY